MGAREGDIGFLLYVEFAFLMYRLELFFFIILGMRTKNLLGGMLLLCYFRDSGAEREGEGGEEEGGEEGEEGRGGRIYFFVWV